MSLQEPNEVHLLYQINDLRIRIADILSYTINRYQDDHIVMKYSEKFSGLLYKMFLKNITTQKSRTYFKSIFNYFHLYNYHYIDRIIIPSSK